MSEKDIIIEGKTVKGIEIPLHNSILVMVIGAKGYLMCGYLNIEIAEKMGDAAAIVRGVKNIEDLLAGNVVAVTAKAKEAGITPGMTGKDALLKLF